MATGRLPDPNTAPLTAKGDLYTYSTVPARLAVGSNGDTLVADSSASTGLRWQGNFAAGKNKIINGDFFIAQRGTSFSAISSSQYVLDRWRFENNGTGTATVSQQSFTAGAAPVAGYENAFFIRCATNSVGTSTAFDITQRIEDVRTFAGQTITVSFWAKADSARTIQPILGQNFGSGGSSAVFTFGTNISITTGWVRYSQTFATPSISGNTIGTSSFFQLFLRHTPASGAIIDIWGVQVEAGSVATPFTTATGTLAGELAACQRYYFRYASSQYLGVGHLQSTTAADFYIKTPVTMRTSPTYAAASGTNFFQVGSSAVTASYSTIGNFYSSGTDGVLGRITVSGFTAGQGCAIVMGSASAWVEGSAEL